MLPKNTRFWFLIIVGIGLSNFSNSLTYVYRYSSKIPSSQVQLNPIASLLGPISPILSLIGVVLVVYGCASISKSKGHSWAWGLTGIIWILGPIVAFMLPSKTSSSPTSSTSSSTWKGLWRKTAAMSLIPSLIFFVISTFLMMMLGMGGSGMAQRYLNIYGSIIMFGIVSPQIIYALAAIYFYKRSQQLDPSLTKQTKLLYSLLMFLVSFAPYLITALLMLATNWLGGLTKLFIK